MEDQLEYRKSRIELWIIIALNLLIALVIFALMPGLKFLLVVILLVIIYQVLDFYRTIIRLTDDQIILRRGILTVHTTEIPYSKINTVSSSVGILGHFGNYGTIKIYSGNDISGIVFKGIDSVEKLKSLLQRAISYKK